jgi:hypothetical protein
MYDMLFYQGVYYTLNPNNTPDYYISYSYQRRYKGEIVDTITIYCKNANDFLKLLKYWNGIDKNWIYIPV